LRLLCWTAAPRPLWLPRPCQMGGPPAQCRSCRFDSPRPAPCRARRSSGRQAYLSLPPDCLAALLPAHHWPDQPHYCSGPASGHPASHGSWGQASSGGWCLGSSCQLCSAGWGHSDRTAHSDPWKALLYLRLHYARPSFVGANGVGVASMQIWRHKRSGDVAALRSLCPGIGPDGNQRAQLDRSEYTSGHTSGGETCYATTCCEPRRCRRCNGVDAGMHVLPGMTHFVLHLAHSYGVWALFVLLLIEEAGVPLPAPGDTLIALAGAQPQRTLPYTLEVLGLCTLAVFLGSSALYWVMRLGGRSFLMRYGHYLHLNPQRLARMETWLAQRGTLAIILGRLIPGLRVPTTVMCGLSGVP